MRLPDYLTCRVFARHTLSNAPAPGQKLSAQNGYEERRDVNVSSIPATFDDHLNIVDHQCSADITLDANETCAIRKLLKRSKQTPTKMTRGPFPVDV